MTPQQPVLDVLIGRDGPAWRLYFAANSSIPTTLHRHVDGHGEIYPVGRPDLRALARFMCASDAPYQKRPTTEGGVHVLAAGRPALRLTVWLEQLVSRSR